MEEENIGSSSIRAGMVEYALNSNPDFSNRNRPIRLAVQLVYYNVALSTPEKLCQYSSMKDLAA